MWRRKRRDGELRRASRRRRDWSVKAEASEEAQARWPRRETNAPRRRRRGRRGTRARLPDRTICAARRRRRGRRTAASARRRTPVATVKICLEGGSRVHSAATTKNAPRAPASVVVPVPRLPPSRDLRVRLVNKRISRASLGPSEMRPSPSTPPVSRWSVCRLSISASRASRMAGS